MRWFWGLILVLQTVTLGLFVVPQADDAPPVAMPAIAAAARAGRPPAHQLDAVESPAAAVAMQDSASPPLADFPLADIRDAPTTATGIGPNHNQAESPRGATSFQLIKPIAPASLGDISAAPSALDELLSVPPPADGYATTKPAAPTASAVAPLPDGGIKLAQMFEIPGQGTQQSPYEISWDALVEVRKYYRPRKNLLELPEWIMALDGKWVTLRGYLLLPVMQQSTQDVLLMRNMWDGCCIGVPPSPYDAVEVRLARPSKQMLRTSFNYGSVTGILQVDPYLVKDWLVGLYLMEEARLETLGF